MKTVTITSNSTTTFDANDGNTTYVIASSAHITAYDLGISAYNKAANRNFVIDGTVDGGSSAGMDVGDYATRKGAGDITIGATGKIEAYTFGILTNGNGQTIENGGTIHADQIAIRCDGGDTRVTNTGSLSSEGYGVGLIGADSVVRNQAVITGTEDGVFLSGANDKLINTGSISGDTGVEMGKYVGGTHTVVVNLGTLTGGTYAIRGYDLGEIVRNHGSIYGNIDLGGGNDTYIVDSTTMSLVEDQHGGQDTVRASVSFTLADNFEALVLTGKAGLNGMGNGGSNHMTGNAGSNTLNGGTGDDILSGGKGNDYLVGGADADTFVFATGFGHDTIADMTKSGKQHDVIDLSGIDGINSFAVLQAHMHQNGGDLEINFGHGDRLTLAGVHAGDLHVSDFQF